MPAAADARDSARQRTTAHDSARQRTTAHRQHQLHDHPTNERQQQALLSMGIESPTVALPGHATTKVDRAT
eukprot:CAMPEP_0119476584 /NCGR_PEP_ID=MMETSP1344-20130328/7044_1 /TAXON_ID=236787 /ORGANISM="Florenciella parvula, Strain CCMP2471" /LENGTH=70 /DNA_ID=CAMNT_0007510371 /DNA_START=159 /DNA_END=368 /DNA_ORIENTATION=-